VNDKHGHSPDQIQAKLKNLQHAAGHQNAEVAGGDVEITVASQRDAFDLKACRTLLEKNGISSKFVGRGFNQVIVVSRGNSTRAIDAIASQRERLLRQNPLSAGDYVVGILAWAFGCGLSIPAVSGLLLLYRQFDVTFVFIVVAILLVCSFLMGGLLGYLRCRAIASRKRR
jgi:hypothetical protein